MSNFELKKEKYIFNFSHSKVIYLKYYFIYLKHNEACLLFEVKKKKKE